MRLPRIYFSWWKPVNGSFFHFGKFWNDEIWKIILWRLVITIDFRDSIDFWSRKP